MTLHRRHFLAGAAGLAALSPSLSQAQTRWQMATPYADGNLHTRNIRTFIEDIQKASNGQLAVQLHSNGALLKMPEIKRGVQTGQAQLGEILMSAYGNEDPFFEVDSVPQLVTSTAQARKLAELQRPYVEARLQRQGITLLYMVPWPQSGFYTNVPVESIETLRGMKMRTFNALTNRFATLAGATPTLVQQAEVPQAFATGVVNAMVTSAADRLYPHQERRVCANPCLAGPARGIPARCSCRGRGCGSAWLAGIGSGNRGTAEYAGKPWHDGQHALRCLDAGSGAHWCHAG